MRLQGRSILGAAVGLVMCAMTAPAAAQSRLTSDAIEMELSGRFQTQLATSSCADFDPEDTDSACRQDAPGLDLFIRRARLTLDVRVNEWISGRLQPDFGEVDGVDLKDAYGLLDLDPDAVHPHARIRIGQFKRPFDGFQLTSSTRILTIERDLDVAGIPGRAGLSLDELTTRNQLSDRDIGVMVDGSDPEDRFHYWLGVFNGRRPADNGDLDTEKQLVGRGRVNLTAGAHPLALAAAVAVTDVPFLREDGTLGGRYYGNVELWAELGDWDEGPHAQAGVVFGKNALEDESGEIPDLEAGDPLASMLTWQAIGSWKIELDDDVYFLEAVEPLLRITMADPNRDLDDDVVWGFTPGVQIFFAGRNKLAVNWDFVSFAADGVGSESSIKAQYQLHF